MVKDDTNQVIAMCFISSFLPNKSMSCRLTRLLLVGVGYYWAPTSLATVVKVF